MSLPNPGCFLCRIRGGVQGGAWCPKARISQGIYEYLQIDLGRLKVITMVETQGRFNNGEVSFDDDCHDDNSNNCDGFCVGFCVNINLY